MVALDSQPSRVRPAFAALWDIDLAMADVVAASSQPTLGAIKLAWWREALERLDFGEVPQEPRLRAVADQLIRRGITGSEISGLEDGWLPLLETPPWGQSAADGLRRRGRLLFRIGARLLDCDPADAEAAGALWSLVDGARNITDFYTRRFLLDEARKAIADLPRSRPPRKLRNLTTLAAVAAHDVLRDKPLDLGNGFGRMATATIHRMNGTLPKG